MTFILSLEFFSDSILVAQQLQISLMSHMQHFYFRLAFPACFSRPNESMKVSSIFCSFGAQKKLFQWKSTFTQRVEMKRDSHLHSHCIISNSLFIGNANASKHKLDSSDFCVHLPIITKC